MTRRVLITGAAGLIGQYLMNTATRWAPGWAVRGVSRADVDLTEPVAVEAAWNAIRPDAVIHCAAFSRTHDCELDPDRARLVNVIATTRLASLAADIPFVFLSSGEVFDGQRGWYTEDDLPNPINVYGRTKLEAERIVLQNARHTVLRLVLTAGTSLHGDRSFVEDMCRAARAGKDVTLYADEFRCPLPAGVIARALWECWNRTGPVSIILAGGSGSRGGRSGRRSCLGIRNCEAASSKARPATIRARRARRTSRCGATRSNGSYRFRFRG